MTVAREFLGAGWSFPIALDPRGEIALVAGDQCVHQAVRVILATRLGERAMRPEFGGGLDALVHEPLSTATAALASLGLETRFPTVVERKGSARTVTLVSGGDPRMTNTKLRLLAKQTAAALKSKHPQAEASIEQALQKNGLTDDSAGYLPLDAQKADPADWVVIVERASGQPRAFLPLDGW
mgnify:CR=1 FL=1